DGALAEEAGAGVGVEHADEKVFAFGGAGVDDFSVFESQSHAAALAAVVDGREAEIDLAVHAVDHGAGENFAVGKIFVAVAVDPRVPGDAHANIGAVGGDDVIILLAVQQIDESLLPLADFLPLGNRIVAIEQPGTEDEIF